MKKWVFVLIGAIISLGYVGSAEADKAFLKALQDTLAKLGNPWIAGETELSDLPIEEKRAMCGFVPMPEEEWGGEWGRDLEEIKSPPLKNPPASFDWRNKDGKDWTTPVKYQHPCQNCWAFAMCSSMEAVIKIANNTPDATPDLSEQFLTNCNTKGKSCMGGGNFSVYDDVKSFGVPDEACFPYEAKDLPCGNRCTDWQSRAVRIESYRSDFYPNVSDAQKKTWIMEGPVALAITVKEDFFYYKGGVYEPIMGEKMANHAVCGIGWTSDGKWICKNSWGRNRPYIITSVIEYLCWVKMKPDTGTPIIWTSESLNFVFGEKGVFSPNPSIHSSDSDKTSSSASLEFILHEGEHILKPSQIENIRESSKSEEDTLQYDDPGDNIRIWTGAKDWGVRFTPPRSCNVIAGLSGRITETEAKNDKLIVRDDASGNPGTTIEEVPYTTQTGASARWYRQDLSTPYSDDNDFWLTYYAETGSDPRSVFISDQAGGERSYYILDGESSWDQHVADLYIRAIVTYGGGYAGSGTIWVKNTGAGQLAVSNVHSTGNPGWIESISPKSFNVYGGDSVGIEVGVDTSGLQEEVLYQDEIVITSNSGKAENRVPITLLIKTTGVAEEKESMLATFKLSPNPFGDKVGISYFVPKKANVKLVVCDIAGREVARIVDRVENTGIKKIEWDTKNIPSGVYFCRLTTGKSEATRKVLLVR